MALWCVYSNTVSGSSPDDLLLPADPHQDIILAEGISNFCDDLVVEPTDIVLVSSTNNSSMALRKQHEQQEWQH